MTIDPLPKPLPIRTQLSAIIHGDLQYINTGDDDTYIEYNVATQESRVIVLSQLRADGDAAQAQMDDLPEPPPDDVLLAWALENYPMQGTYNSDRARLQKIIDDAAEILEVVQ